MKKIFRKKICDSTIHTKSFMNVYTHNHKKYGIERNYENGKLKHIKFGVYEPDEKGIGFCWGNRLPVNIFLSLVGVAFDRETKKMMINTYLSEDFGSGINIKYRRQSIKEKEKQLKKAKEQLILAEQILSVVNTFKKKHKL